MKRVWCFILLCLFFSAGIAQNDSILKCVPKKYQTGVVVYYYDKTDYYFVFKAKDYLKSLKRVVHRGGKSSPEFKCDDVYSALNQASQQQMTTMVSDDLDCFMVDFILSQLFLKNKIIVVLKIGENEYGLVDIRKKKSRYYLNVLNKSNLLIIFEGFRSSVRRMKIR